MLDTNHRHTVEYSLEKTAQRLHEPFPWLTGEALLNMIWERDRQLKKGLFREPVKPDSLLRPKEVQRMLGISKTWFWDLLSNGVLPRVRLARNAVRVPLSAVHDYIEARKAEAQESPAPNATDKDVDPGNNARDRTPTVSTDVRLCTSETRDSAQEKNEGELP